MKFEDKIYIACHTGLVGSVIAGTLKLKGFINLFYDTSELDLKINPLFKNFLKDKSLHWFFLPRLMIGVIAGTACHARFSYDNMIVSNAIHVALQ
jgi:hypothetical protein